MRDVSDRNRPGSAHLASGRTVGVRPFPAAFREQAPSAPVLVDVQQTSITYGAVKVLQNISWTMRRGEHWVFIKAQRRW